MLQSLGRVVATQAASLTKTMPVHSHDSVYAGSRQIKCLARTSEWKVQLKRSSKYLRKKKIVLNFSSLKIIVTTEV